VEQPRQPLEGTPIASLQLHSGQQERVLRQHRRTGFGAVVFIGRVQDRRNGGMSVVIEMQRSTGHQRLHAAGLERLLRSCRDGP
jgi:hypothetical protein